MHRKLTALGPWLAEAKYVWIALCVSLVAVALCARPGTSEPFIRLIGLALQILGIATVIWGILETRAFFGRPTLLVKVRNWIDRCPLRAVKISVGVGTAVARGVAGKLRGHGSAPINPSAPTDERLANLEKNVSLLHERITAVTRDLDTDIGALRSQVERESEERHRGTAEVRKQLEGVATGGIHITSIGAAWLFVGVVLSTAAPELATLLK